MYVSLWILVLGFIFSITTIAIIIFAPVIELIRELNEQEKLVRNKIVETLIEKRGWVESRAIIISIKDKALLKALLKIWDKKFQEYVKKGE